MDIKTYNEHVKAMDRIESMEHLRELRVSPFPNLKEDAQAKYHRDISKKAFPVQKVHSFDDIERALGIR